MDGRMHRKSASKWSKDGERILIEVWAENMSLLRACRKNSHILAEMALEMEKRGLSYTSGEIKTKMHNMTNKYRKEKARIGLTGNSPSEWDLYEEMENLLGSFESISSGGLVADSIKNINSSIVIDPLSPATNLQLDASSRTSQLKPPDSPLSDSSDSSSSNASFSTARKKKEFDKFFENLEQIMEKINEDLKITVEKIITIEEEKRDILKEFVEKEGEVQEALLEFLKRQ